MTSDNEPGPRPVLGRLLLISGGLGALATAIMLFVLLPGQAGLYHITGTWAALATDVVDGVLYRPVLAPDGYGGTRYVPLFFLLHGALIKMTGNAILAGRLLTLAALGGLLSGVYLLLRRLLVEVVPSLAATGLVLAAGSTQWIIACIQADLLAVALNVWGLVFCVRGGRVDVRTVPAALFFVLAFLTKLTMVFGVAAVVLTLAVDRRWKPALYLAALVGAGFAVGLGVAHVASDGRMFESLRAMATAGGTVSEVLASPLLFLRSAVFDLPFLGLFLCAAVGLAIGFRQLIRGFPAILFVCTATVTVAIFGSPGTSINHLVDLHVAALVFLTVHLARGSWSKLVPRAFSAAAILAAVLTLLVVGLAAVYLPPAMAGKFDRVLAAAGDGPGPLLSEDPWFPIVAGERPFLLDATAMNVASRSDPRIGRDLWSRLARHEFRAVILAPPRRSTHGIEDLREESWRGQPWYGGVHFPDGFLDELLRHYEPEEYIGPYVILLPRRGQVSNSY